MGAFAGLAAARGVRQLVLLSGRGEDEAQRTEQLTQDAGTEWTILRSSWMNQNFSEGYLLDGVLAGEISLPVDHTREPFVDADDIADVAVAALTEPQHTGQLYELTGPRLLTFADVSEDITDATGRKVAFRSLPMPEFTTQLNRAGVPDDVIWLLNYLFTTVLDGRNAHLTDGVQRALGREPKDFADYAREAAAIGVWNDQ